MVLQGHYPQPSDRDRWVLWYKGGMTPNEIKLTGKILRLEEQLRTERERNDRLLQTNQKLIIHSVHQQDEIDNLNCYLSYYLKHGTSVS